jgi:hypothetical protein
MSTVYHHPSNTQSFEQFRAFYTLPKRNNGAFMGLPMIPGGKRHQPENDIYDYYLSAAQNPFLAQQVNTAATRLLEDTLTQMIPSWTELLRIGIRSAQEQWISRRSSVFRKDTKGKTVSLRNEELPRRFYRWM